MMQVIELTHEETVAMYIKTCTKAQLAEMLANCNEILGKIPVKITSSETWTIHGLTMHRRTP